MNIEPTDRLFDYLLLDLRQTLADTHAIADAIHALGPSPEATRMLPNLYTQLGTLQGIVRRCRYVLKRAMPPEARSS